MGNLLHETISVEYLAKRIDSKFNWKFYIGDIVLKLIGANAVLYKVRDYLMLEP